MCRINIEETRFKKQGPRKTRNKKQVARIQEETRILLMSQELENRFEEFAKRVRDFCLELKFDVINREYISQLIRSSGSVDANYIEASDSLGKADESMKLKISRREAKESVYWLKLLLTYDDRTLEESRLSLIDEAQQIKKILSAIINKL